MTQPAPSTARSQASALLYVIPLVKPLPSEQVRPSSIPRVSTSSRALSPLAVPCRSLPLCLSPNPRPQGKPLAETYAAKSNLWIAVFSFIGNYWRAPLAPRPPLPAPSRACSLPRPHPAGSLLTDPPRAGAACGPAAMPGTPTTSTACSRRTTPSKRTA